MDHETIVSLLKFLVQYEWRVGLAGASLALGCVYVGIVLGVLAAGRRLGQTCVCGKHEKGRSDGTGLECHR